MEEILACTTRFGNESEALAYAIHNQRNRRNLTEAELLRCIEAKEAGISDHVWSLEEIAGLID
jgi:hypothetical protein